MFAESVLKYTINTVCFKIFAHHHDVSIGFVWTTTLSAFYV